MRSSKLGVKRKGPAGQRALSSSSLPLLTSSRVVVGLLSPSLGPAPEPVARSDCFSGTEEDDEDEAEGEV